MREIASTILICLTCILLLSAVAANAAAPTVADVIDVAKVWPGEPVGFQLLTHGDKQYVAFYDANRHMVVGSRSLDSKDWLFKTLPTDVGWDGHNYVRIAFDDAGQLHLSGNMHNVPLIYFRTTTPGDITTLTRIKSMVGTDEDSCTYPTFLRGPTNQFLFTYRFGHSGGGAQIFNIYDTATQKWHRLLDKPLTDGGKDANAYMVGPTRGPDGFFHLVWVWRNTGDCATNHDLSYARSKDLIHWETSSGKPLPLPLTQTNSEIVDPVPTHGGIINGNTQIGFDNQKRVILSYHKFDAAGNTQIYNARREGDRWVIYQTSDWNYRWDPSGFGSIPFDIRPGPVDAHPDGTLTESYSHIKFGSGIWKLDPATLKPIGTVTVPPVRPPDLDKVESDFKGMHPRWAGDSGSSGEKNVRYWLRWETLEADRDKPRQPPLPEASMLRVYKIVSGD
jgi:hypothetical protein